ncbi:MAG: group II truncated hemoglobin [Gammaproteobacteria bacterium]
MQSSYERLGGEDELRALVDRFYDYMDSLPEAKTLRDVHSRDLTSAREKLFMFLSGWLGGPDRYIEAFGHPRLRARHLPFSIGIEEKEQWMLCMHKAFDSVEVDNAFKQQLLSALNQTANHMINRSE